MFFIIINLGENYKTEGYVMTPNTMKHMEKHLKITGGGVSAIDWIQSTSISYTLAFCHFYQQR